MESRFTDKTNRAVALLIFLTVVAGAATVFWTVQRADLGMRKDRLRAAELVARSLNLQRLGSLSGSVSDVENPVYLRLKRQLSGVAGADVKCRFIYLMGRRDDGRVFFYVDSEPSGSEDESPAGQIYEEISADYLRAFDMKTALSVGPVTDRWGTWITSLVPIQDPQTGDMPAVLGMDMDAKSWRAELLGAAVPPCVATIALITILSFGMALSFRRRHTIHSTAGGSPLLEPIITATVGLVLTLFAAWLAHDQETRTHLQTFRQLANGKAAALMERFWKLRDVELEGLARFVENSQEVHVSEFQNYAGHLAQNSAVQAWEWIPAVPAGQKGRIQTLARDQGMSGFTIWQKDTSGQRVPAGDRAAHYPVYYVSPPAGNESAVGFDLGSEPLRREALEKATETGLTTCTEPITLVQETGSQQAVLVYRPVFAPGESRKVRGFALAVLRMGDVLQCARPCRNVALSLTLAHPGGEATMLASASGPDRLSDSRWSVNSPILAFGKTFIVNAHPGPEFVHDHSPKAVWLAVFSGFILSAAAVVVTGVILQRRRRLEEMVAERTAELAESQEKLAATLRSIGDAVISTDARGLVDGMNAVAEGLLGWTGDEVRGKPLCDIFRIINGRTKEPVDIPIDQLLATGETLELPSDTMLIARDATRRRVADSAAPIRDEDGVIIGAVLVFRDVSEEYKTRKELRESKADYEAVIWGLSDIVWRYEVDENGVFAGSYISPVADHMLGLPAGSIGHSFDKFFSYALPDDLADMRNALTHGHRSADAGDGRRGAGPGHQVQ